MISKLPGWVISDEDSVRAEVARWRDLTPAERWELARACSRDVMWAISVSKDQDRIFEHVDPLPESTLEALERLRARTGWGRGHA